jgi:hypothetical protein
MSNSHWALRLYPPSFRARYGTELDALVADLPRRRGTGLDLLRGAALAWLRPAFLGDRAARLRASLATTWVAWCAGFLVAPVVTWMLLDEPVPGLPAWAPRVLTAAQVLFFVGWALALLGALPVLASAVWPALRRSDRGLRPLVPALALGVLVAIGAGVLALLRGTRPDPSDAYLAVVALWLLCGAGFVVCLGIGPAVTLRRLRPDGAALRLPAVLAVAVALVLAAVTGTSFAAAVSVGVDVRSETIMAVGLAVGCGASLVALVSSVRGLRALR